MVRVKRLACILRTFSVPALLCGAFSVALAQEPADIGEVFAADASVRGSVVFSSGGTRVMSGSQVSAGTSPARLQLARGGSVRICSKTVVSVVSGPRKEFLFGLNSGAMELHYSNGAVTDALVTPDFRLQLTGPGEFHFAVRVEQDGTTCVRALKGNAAGIIVMELLGAGFYQVTPGKAVLFRKGNLQSVTVPEGVCGCSADEAPLPPAPAEGEAASVAGAASLPDGMHLEAEAPLAYHGNPEEAEPAAQIIHLSARADNLDMYKSLQPQGKPAEPPKLNIFQRLGRALRRLFGGK